MPSRRSSLKLVALQTSAVTLKSVFNNSAAAITSKFEEPLYLTEVLIAAPEGGLVMDSVALLN